MSNDGIIVYLNIIAWLCKISVESKLPDIITVAMKNFKRIKVFVVCSGNHTRAIMQLIFFIKTNIATTIYSVGRPA